MALWRSSAQVLCLLCEDDRLSQTLIAKYVFSVMPYFLVIFVKGFCEHTANLFPGAIKQLLRVIEFHWRGLIHHTGCLSDSLCGSCIAEQVSGTMTHARTGMLKNQTCFFFHCFWKVVLCSVLWDRDEHSDKGIFLCVLRQE